MQIDEDILLYRLMKLKRDVIDKKKKVSKSIRQYLGYSPLPARAEVSKVK